ncbi:MAG: T9SS type A sorting domain-containing protein [Candidatus Kapabacteria bacterium]|nr:T9SS type A sorting domain-containing protein [Candidatus Kapabacteria bacterium]
MKKLIQSILINILIVSAVPIYAQKWEPFNAGLDSIEINCMTSNNKEVFIGTSKNGVVSSNIVLDDWNKINSGIDTLFPGIHSIASGHNIILAGHSMGLFISRDEGNSWNNVNDGILSSGYTSISTIISFSDNLIYSDASSIYLSKNNGLNWSLVGSGGNYRLISSIVSNGKDIYAGTLNGIVLSSSDFGKSWEKIHEFPAQILSLSSEANVLIVCTDKGVYLTNNLLNWTNIDDGLSNLLVKSVLITTKYIFAATNNGVFKAEKSSVIKWTPFNDGLLNLDVGFLTQTGNMLFAGTYSGEVYKLDLSLLGVDDSIHDDIFSISPNPATDFIEINMNNKANLIASELQIFNMLGIDMSPAGGGVSGADGGGFRIDISHLPSGVYYIRIGDKVEKFLKM